VILSLSLPPSPSLSLFFAHTRKTDGISSVSGQSLKRSDAREAASVALVLRARGGCDGVRSTGVGEGRDGHR
jgi:hypothetical protein